MNFPVWLMPRIVARTITFVRDLWQRSALSTTTYTVSSDVARAIEAIADAARVSPGEVVDAMASHYISSARYPTPSSTGENHDVTQPGTIRQRR